MKTERFSKIYFRLSITLIPFVIFVILEQIYTTEYVFDNIAFFGGLMFSISYLLIYIYQYIINKTYNMLQVLHDCHCIPERTIIINGRLMPVCARCTGINFGILLTPVIFYFVDLPFYIFPLFIVPIVIDGYTQKHTKYVSTNFRRFITGLLFGFLFAFAYGIILHYISFGFRYVIELFI